MKKSIWKFSLNTAGSFEVSMPKGAKILSLQTQNGVPCIGAEVDVEAEKEVRKFSTYGTGHSLPDEPGNQIGTYQMEGESLIWHVYEK